MKTFLLIAILTFAAWTLQAQDDSTHIETPHAEAPQEPVNVPVVTKVADKLEWYGSLLTDNRYNFNKHVNTFAREEYRLSLTPVFKTNRTAFRGDIWVRTLNYPVVTSYTALSDINTLRRLDIDIREAYFDVYDFLIKGLDLRAGRQRIAWGSADRLNPTDNLNPYDFEDLWDFGRHLGSNSIKLSYYVSDLTFTGVFIPVFTPSLAPEGSLIDAFMPEVAFPASVVNNNSIIYLKYNSITDTLVLPEKNIGNSIFGFKVEKPFGNFNTSVSFVRGRDILPAPVKTSITPLILAGDTMTINVRSQLLYPRMDIIGFDFAGSLFNMGVWGEAALFFPEKITNNTTMSLLGLTLLEEDSVTVDDKPFVRFAAGLDYTFSNGAYLNMQYLHGFVHEKGKDLNDYYIVALNYPVLNGKLTLSPINACLQVDDYSDFMNKHALIYMPEISYSGIDNTAIALGMRLIDGNRNTGFGRLGRQDEVFVRLKYSF